MDQDHTYPIPETQPPPVGSISPAWQPRSPRFPRAATPPPKRRFSKKRIIAITLAILGALILASAGWVGWKFIRATEKATGGNIFGLLSSTKLDGEDQGRVNILLAGNSADDPGHGGSNLTDSIMILSIDTKTNAAFMLSVPRDLWVKIPGYGYGKINSAYADGGMSLLEEVVDQDFGLHMNYYALTDYTAFKQAVNAVGGIDVRIQSSDSRGIYDPNIAAVDHGPLILKNGLQHLDGQTALNLARARNDPTPSGRVGYGLPGGDFDRAANQRLMLAALETKALSTSVLSNPIKIGQLFDSLGDNVTTNFKTNELFRLYTLAKKINASSIKSLNLTDKDLIKNYTTSDNQAALIPSAGLGDYTAIQLFMRQQTSDNPIVKEGATAVVLNGSGVNGLAKKEAAALVSKGVDVTTYATASQNYPATTLVDNSGGATPATVSLLKSLFNPTLSTSTTLARSYDVDFVIILGADQSSTQP